MLFLYRFFLRIQLNASSSLSYRADDPFLCVVKAVISSWSELEHKIIPMDCFAIKTTEITSALRHKHLDNKPQVQKKFSVNGTYKRLLLSTEHSVDI